MMKLIAVAAKVPAIAALQEKFVVAGGDTWTISTRSSTIAGVSGRIDVMTCLIRAETADAFGHEANKHLMPLVPQPLQISAVRTRGAKSARIR